MALARRQLCPIRSGRVHLSFVWFCRNRRKDPDNISSAGRKIILDGLVSAGILQNDGWKFSDSFEVGRDQPREVVMMEYS